MQTHEDTTATFPDEPKPNLTKDTLSETAGPGSQPDSNPSPGLQATRHDADPIESQAQDVQVESKDSGDLSNGDALVEAIGISESSTPSGNIQDCIVHAPVILQTMSGPHYPVGDMRQLARLSKATGMSDRLGVNYQVIPPGFRTSCPHAHSAEDELVFCLQGRGIIWQNGWTYPFVPGDVAGWKAGTGITHTIINDTKRLPDETGNDEEEDLIILVIGEHKPGEDLLYYPLHPENYDIPGRLRWDDPQPQNHWGQHPGVPRAERPNDTLPGVQAGARPSNIINWQEQLAPAGEGDLFAYATSLSQETGLSGRFGCNLEIAPPGARSSDPHAHSVEDELVFIVQGEGSVWLDGHTFPVSVGDAIGFRGGTGLAHTIINDSNASGESGQDLVMWIVGENRRSEDKVVYPVHPEKKETFKRWWEDAPQRKLGNHSGRPKYPRA